MSRIEMVMHLQSLDLFRSCAASEAVRLAQIAKLLQLAEGDVVYRPTEPAEMLYSVVEGLILVEDNNGSRQEVGPQNAFGVLEVLSGRQRCSRAEARTATLVLAIAEDDFFDLLSNNINIVKALFREVLDESGRHLPEGQLDHENGLGLSLAEGSPEAPAGVDAALEVDSEDDSLKLGRVVLEGS